MDPNGRGDLVSIPSGAFVGNKKYVMDKKYCEIGFLRNRLGKMKISQLKDYINNLKMMRVTSPLIIEFPLRSIMETSNYRIKTGALSFKRKNLKKKRWEQYLFCISLFFSFRSYTSVQ